MSAINPLKTKKTKESFKWETCKHVQDIGQYAVFVRPSCRGEVHAPKGTLVVAKFRCQSCPYWEPKEEK